MKSLTDTVAQLAKKTEQEYLYSDPDNTTYESVSTISVSLDGTTIRLIDPESRQTSFREAMVGTVEIFPLHVFQGLTGWVPFRPQS
jgi:hypothetical protein